MEIVNNMFEILDSGSQHIFIKEKQILLNAGGLSLYTVI
jgi:hypothetical protein